MTHRPLTVSALRALSQVEVEGQTARIAGQLDRALYLEVNKALEALGGKWSRKLSAHVFDGKTQDELRDALEDVLACGGFVDKRQDLGQFFTPAVLADRLVALAEIEPGHSVLEPSAGTGHLILAIRRRFEFGIFSGPIAVSAIEIDPLNVKQLHAAANEAGTISVTQRDFLTMQPKPGEGVDRVVMNPPFRRGADIEHVLHAWKFLKPGGRLVSVMAAGVTFRQDKRSAEFRAFARKNTPRSLDATALLVVHPGVSPDGFLLLPAGSFAASGTEVNTVVIVLEKPK